MISSPPPPRWQVQGLSHMIKVCSPINNMEIAKRLLAFQNIYQAKFYAILLALTNIQQISCNIHIFPHIQNNIYLINNHVGRPSSQVPNTITHENS